MLSRTVRFASLVLAGEFAGLRERWTGCTPCASRWTWWGLGF